MAGDCDSGGSADPHVFRPHQKGEDFGGHAALQKHEHVAFGGRSGGQEIGNINDVIDILYDAGYVLANLNPSAEGYWYAWDSETNQMLYLDETFSVSFHVRELKTAEANEKWIVVVSGADDYAQVKAAGCTPSASVVEDAAAFLQAIEAGDNVILSGDLTLTGYDKDNPLTVDYSDVVIDLNRAFHDDRRPFRFSDRGGERRD